MLRRLLQRLPGRGPAALPVVDPEHLHSAFQPDELGPTPAAEAVVLGDSRRVPGSTTDREAWVLAVLARHSHRCFEFGTATGRTAYLWARNSPEHTTVTTLTLPPERIEDYQHGRGDSRRDRRHALRESRFKRFRYQGTPVEHRVVQLYGDSKEFDETPFTAACDLIFIDGSHAYSYVRSDTTKALRMLAPGGLLLWHDYGRAAGVTRHLRELARERPLVHLRASSLAAYRAPLTAPAPHA